MQLTWPDELKSFLEQEAEKAGYSSVDDFTLQTFLNANALNATDEDLDLTETSALNVEDLERELVAGINSGPATPMTKADWEELRKRVLRRLGGSSPT
jgi:hypothetical protein